MSSPTPPPEDFSGGSVLPGAVAGCALPVVGILLAFLLGLGLIVWSGLRGGDDAAEGAVIAAVGGAGLPQTPVSADR